MARCLHFKLFKFLTVGVSLCFGLSPYPPLQDSVFPGDELVSHSHVHLLLVLRHRRHGDCWLYLQVYRVCRVSEAQPQKRLDSLAAFGFCRFLCVCVRVHTLQFKSFLLLSSHHPSFLGVLRKTDVFGFSHVRVMISQQTTQYTVGDMQIPHVNICCIIMGGLYEQRCNSAYVKHTTLFLLRNKTPRQKSKIKT